MSPFLTASILWQPAICFLFVWICLNVSYKWNHITCDLLCLISFPCLMFCRVHPYSINQHFIPSMTESYSTVWMDQNLFICSLMDSLVVSTFGLLWIVLLWIFVCKYLRTYFQFFGSIYIEMELLGHVVILYINFLRNCQTIFHNILYVHQQFLRVSVSLHSFLILIVISFS